MEPRKVIRYESIDESLEIMARQVQTFILVAEQLERLRARVLTETPEEILEHLDEMLSLTNVLDERDRR